ncbi:DUF3048 domain-containing protein [Bacillus carboniphilus]|uniref:DUF3048 domain-containing protein n=1 Tax=Bacillus carboniphilus TaxID=86663 RepID=A0ABY9JS85_9BACI|nr:DUF3048 domain-containing protein [Bacillus carboniphilus]WLR42251.1 DUF3048 domain-containing protein [Bacillus carboniphilus]
MKRFIIMVVTMVLLVVGCSNKENVEVDQTKEQKPVTEQKVEEREVITYPLTGLDDGEDINQRPLAIVINNHPKARPQSGLEQADIVYEVLAEGNVTRFLAVFQSEMPTGLIGPVRSARDYFIDLSKGYDAIFVSHGWSGSAKEKLQTLKEADYINGLFYDGSLFQRVDFRSAPHNSYISYDNLKNGAEQLGYEFESEVDPMTFYEEDNEIVGEDQETVTIAYSNSNTWKVTYQYNSSNQNYERYSNDELTVDLETENPIQLDNVLVVEANHQIVDDSGHKSIDLLSGGEAYLYQKGKKIDVQWKNENNRILPYKEGEQVPFVQGKTWINIVPSLDKVKDIE